MKRRILIEVTKDNAFQVWDGAKTTGLLTFGEMMEQITSMVHPKLGYEQYLMLSKQGWEERRNRLSRR